MSFLRFLMFAAVATVLTSLSTDSLAAEPGLYEMRVYYTNEGKLDALHARFRDHTMALFEKHGMTNVGYFVPTGDNPEQKLVYFLAYPDREARDAAWKAFLADPDWQAAYKASTAEGRLVKNVTQSFLETTDFSPADGLANKAAGDRVVQLRTYTATEGNLPSLDARFRDHTIDLFAKHGIENLIYWHRAASEPHADRMLVYLIGHASEEAAAESFAAFRKDPAWTAARKASEEKAGGSLTEKKNGVVAEFLKPTDYSPWK